MVGKLAILGAGNMAEAIARALLRAGTINPTRIVAADHNADRRDLFGGELGIRASDGTGHFAADADAVLLAVKPQHLKSTLADIGPTLRPDALLISIAAGITTGKLEAWAAGEPPHEARRVVRTMPNTPLLVGRGIVAFCPGKYATAEDVATAKSLFPGADLLDVAESQMDALTAISGSGPAYFFAFTEALAAAAEAHGFDRATAYRLAAGTFTGAAALLDQGEHDAAELRKRVTSPGGTTAAALESFERDKLSSIMAAAVGAAARRGRELSSDKSG